MQNLSRRQMLAITAAGLAAAAPSAANAQTPPYLRTDIGALRRVLVHSIVESDTPVDALGESLLPDAESDVGAAVLQQAGLMNLLRGAGVDVVELSDALQTAIDATRESGVFEAWVSALFPRLAGDIGSVNAATILGRDPRSHYRLGADEAYFHAADDSTGTMWTRDSAFMTPQGLVICNSASFRRRRENMLLRFAYAHSPLLDVYHIAFDAVEEGLVIEGGDATVIDERTLFLGTGNRTDPRIAPVLARRLNMDVLTVQTIKRDFLRTGPRLPPTPPIHELRLLFLHLDTFFTLVAPRHALTVPYMLESEYREDSPMARYIRGARVDTQVSEEASTAALEMLKEFGKVKLYRRGTGREEDLGENTKLVDHLRRQRYRFTFTGGARPNGDADAFRYFMEVTYPEHRRQATNIVQAAPGRVIAYAGAPATKAALEADGIAVDTFEGRELWAWHGGPHCLTQPLERV